MTLEETHKDLTNKWLVLNKEMQRVNYDTSPEPIWGMWFAAMTFKVQTMLEQPINKTEMDCLDILLEELRNQMLFDVITIGVKR